MVSFGFRVDRSNVGEPCVSQPEDSSLAIETASLSKTNYLLVLIACSG